MPPDVPSRGSRELTYTNDDPASDPLSALLASDLAQAVAADYGEVARHGDAEIATAELLGRYRHLLADAVEGPVVLLALAAVQVQAGRVLPGVREAALELLDDPATAAGRPGEDQALRRQRRAVLEHLRDRLG